MQNNQETITFTVYNQQADSITGVLLTDTLEPGVTLVSASQQPDQSGQNLAWSLGTIEGDYWTSVSITVSLGRIPASCSWTRAPRRSPRSTPARSRIPRPPPCSRRAASIPTCWPPRPTPTRPIRTSSKRRRSWITTRRTSSTSCRQNIGYNAYVGSLRGARGTLWSDAGNALDVASLGVALMRASGIPAQYVEGTLSTSQAQTLILSMFPASYQTVGYIPAGRRHRRSTIRRDDRADGNC